MHLEKRCSIRYNSYVAFFVTTYSISFSFFCEKSTDIINPFEEFDA